MATGFGDMKVIMTREFSSTEGTKTKFQWVEERMR